LAQTALSQAVQPEVRFGMGNELSLRIAIVGLVIVEVALITTVLFSL
jgi:hypothetical protein